MKLNLNKTQMVVASAIFIAIVLGAAFLHHRAAQAVVAAASAASAINEAPINKAVIAGPGLVEPNSEDVQVGSELAGKLKQVLAEEGDVVKKGQVLAILVNDDYAAQVESSRAQVHQAEAAYQRILNGSRAQERGAVSYTHLDVYKRQPYSLFPVFYSAPNNFLKNRPTAPKNPPFFLSLIHI